MPPPEGQNCPHCGQPVPVGKFICPHCGANLTYEAVNARIAETRREQKEIGSGWTSGCLLQASLWALAAYGLAGYGLSLRSRPGHWREMWWKPWFTPIADAVPLAVACAVYLLLRRRRPAWARGWGYSILMTLIVLLGGLATCR